MCLIGNDGYCDPSFQKMIVSAAAALKQSSHGKNYQSNKCEMLCQLGIASFVAVHNVIGNWDWKRGVLSLRNVLDHEFYDADVR